MSAIEYKMEFFDILKDLSIINNEVIINSNDEDDTIIVRRIDKEYAVAYELIANKKCFNISNMDIGFYKYTEFYQYLKTLNNPEITLDEIYIVMSTNTSKTKYKLCDIERLQPSPKKIHFFDYDVKFNISSIELDEILKMINLIGSTGSSKAQIVNEDNKMVVKILNEDNSFEKKFECEYNKEVDPFDFYIFSDTFKKMPPKNDYVIYITTQGFMRISIINDMFNLNIYTGKIKK